MQESAGDTVHLEKLQVSARVGVPDDERAVPQRLVISLTLWPKANFDRLNDDLTETIDYAAVAKAVRSFVSEREDKLIETLASALAAHLLGSFDLRVITIEVRKFVIPDSEYVAVIVTRSANERR
ncbi:MAG: dihydroneopterin aldolase [Verrucomicrobiota bacterium]|nr:dihydroneopterin aldolase [Verrucomicrobiota bacterium]